MLFKSPIRFTQSWEDHQVIESGLQVKKNDSVVAILSSGDNLLNLLRYEPAVIYGFDIDPAQIYEVKLKITAIEQLPYEDFLVVLGYTGTEGARVRLFHRLRQHLDNSTYSFWCRHINLLEQGLAFQGVTEKYFSFLRAFMRFFLAEEYVHFISAQTREERQKIFEKKLHTPIFQMLTKLFLNNRITTHLLFQNRATRYIPSSFDYQECFWRNMSHACVDIGCVNNPYRYWIFTGKVLEDRHYWQPYLQEKYYGMLQKQTKKIHLVEQNIYHGLKDLESNSIDAFYISDIFDWMSLKEIENTLLEIVRVAKKNARIISFVLNYDKGIPPDVRTLVHLDEKKSQELFSQERVGIYSKINLFVVQK
jgi:S-adenosylmethionine:diacylglycerol 3-amino-3-carboxypropyl transferase